MVPVCDKRYHIYNRFRHFWAEIKKLWNYPLSLATSELVYVDLYVYCKVTVTTFICIKLTKLNLTKDFVTNMYTEIDKTTDIVGQS